MAIVVGVDGSEESKAALRWAIEEARLRQTDVRAVHAWEFPVSLVAPQPFLGEPVVTEPLVDANEFRTRAEQLLDRVVSDVAGEIKDVRVEQDVREGHPSDVLIKAAEEAELLVVGSRGRGGFAGLLLGSVSQACAHHATCPVVIIRRHPPASSP
jgi:nucleotide-binding universal stress UspA family protein